MDIFDKTILLTGGTGSFGNEFVYQLLSGRKFKGTIRIYSRDEFKQYELGRKLKNDKRLRFFIGDVRDKSRLQRATEGVDIVVHAAALKQVPILEYNPFEAVKTNILGSQNVVDCAIDNNVKRAILISSDKAVNPVNLYGATKMVAEKLFIQGNSYVGERPTLFSVVRYGNVAASRGSVVPLFVSQAKSKLPLTVTHEKMTRFWITLKEGVKFVVNSLQLMEGGEIFVPKIPSVRIIDIVRSIAPNAKIKITGVRPGEKLHEFLIGADEARHTQDKGDFFIIEPEFPWWKSNGKGQREYLEEDYFYSSENNTVWLEGQKLKEALSSYLHES